MYWLYDMQRMAWMTDFTSHSLDLMQDLITEHGNVFDMRNSGYDFVSERVDQEIFPAIEPGANASRLKLDTDAVSLRNNFPWFSDRVRQVAQMLDIELPVANIRQHKFVIPDPLAVIPRNMPFTIIADSQYLDWDDSERELIGEDPEYQWLLDGFPAGLHIKPEGNGHIKLGWAYNRTVQFSGYYTRTAENWPLIGPLGKPGLYTAAALSGFGTMAACAAGELCAAHIMGDALPNYARYFHPDRYNDPKVLAEMAELTSDGQL